MPVGSVSSTIRSSRVGDWVERQEPRAMDPQMKDDLAKNEMRLAAIEYLLCQLWVNSMKFGGITEQEFAWRTDAMLTNLNKQAFPGLDHLAPGQLEEAVGHLVDIQRGMLGFQKLPKADLRQ
jgi:hypothetical protein